MAEKDIEALAQAANVQPGIIEFSTWAGSDRQLLALVFTDIARRLITPSLCRTTQGRRNFGSAPVVIGAGPAPPLKPLS
jgi:hypothetical protein